MLDRSTEGKVGFLQIAPSLMRFAVRYDWREWFGLFSFSAALLSWAAAGVVFFYRLIKWPDIGVGALFWLVVIATCSVPVAILFGAFTVVARNNKVGCLAAMVAMVLIVMLVLLAVFAPQ